MESILSFSLISIAEFQRVLWASPFHSVMSPGDRNQVMGLPCQAGEEDWISPPCDITAFIFTLLLQFSVIVTLYF